MKVLFPSRIIDRHVGGNTTYARALRDGLLARGIEVGTMPSGRHPAITLARETYAGLFPRDGAVLHFSADTGPMLPTTGPSVLTVHGVASRWISVARTRRQEAIWRARVRRAIASTRLLISVSQSAATDIADVFDVDRSRISVIPHGIDVESFQVQRSLSGPLHERVPSRFALYVGNVEPRKNLVQLVRAFQRPDLKSAGIPLVIAGRPAWNFQEAMAEIEAADNVVYLGFISDTDRVALMQRCEFFVFPSLYEGFGLPVLEAMAAGAPVVASRRGSLEEVAGPSYEIQELDAAGIEQAILRARDDTSWLEDAGARGIHWASTFRWENSIDEHIRVYKEAMAQ